MKININKNFLSLKESYLFSEIGARVREYSASHPDAKIIRMGIGDVTRPLPEAVVKAMVKAAEEQLCKETFRGYPPEYGYDFLKEAVARHYASFGVELPLGDIFISDGAKSDVGNIVDILGDNTVYLPDPVYPVYMDSNIMSGREIKLLKGNVENGFLPMPDESCGTGVYYMCSPNNPTGAVYDEAQLKIWIDFILKTGSLLIYDSAYEAFIYDDKPKSIFCIEGARECAIEICSFSKTAGFTGTRCAYTVIPSELMAGDVSLNKLWKRRQATKFNGVSYAVQRGAEAAFSPEGMAQCIENIEYYRKNASVLAELFTRKGMFFTGGISSPYIWLKCPEGFTSWKFFSFLLEKAQVVGTPGSGFGECGEGFFRLSSFATYEATLEAAERLDKIL